jgi:hypothetical protein
MIETEEREWIKAMADAARLYHDSTSFNLEDICSWDELPECERIYWVSVETVAFSVIKPLIAKAKCAAWDRGLEAGISYLSHLTAMRTGDRIAVRALKPPENL